MITGNARKEQQLNPITAEENSDAYKGCEAHKRAMQVQNVRMKEKITSGEAI